MNARRKKIIHLSTRSPGGMLSMLRSFEKTGFFDKWNVEPVFSHDEGGLGRRLLIAWAAYIKLMMMLCRNDVALLHVHVAEKGSFFRKSLALLLARLFRVPVIFHMHGSSFRRFYAACPALLRFYIRFCLDSCAAVIALSDNWAAYYGTLTSAPVRVVKNFVPDDDAAKIHETDTDILFLGRLGPRKGVYDLVAAAQIAAGENMPLQIWCGGDGDVAGVGTAVEKAGLRESFHVLGWVGEERRHELLARCGIFVLPSYDEGAPVAILEAMSAGLAIVSTPVGAIPEMIIDGVSGLIVPAGDVAGLAHTLKRLATDAALRENLQQAARKRYEENYTPQRALGDLEAIYRAILSARAKG